MASAAIPVGRAVVQMHDDFYLDLLLHLTFSLAFASPALPSSVPIRHLDRYQRALTRARSLRNWHIVYQLRGSLLIGLSFRKSGPRGPLCALAVPYRCLSGAALH